MAHLSLDWNRRAAKPWPWCACIALVAVVTLNAWVCDDAYITFRSCYHLTHGHGPVYNVGERVQTFTNPLWMLLFSGVYAFTGEAYFTAILVSITVLLLTLGLLHRRIFHGTWAGVAVTFLLGWSLSYVEYSTSGLENVLNGLLLTWFYACFWDMAQGRRKVVMLSLIAALGMVSRMDTALLYWPALAQLAWQGRSRRVLGWLLLGMLPFLAWEVFAVVYYGFPFPNAAYAKLNAGIPQAIYWEHGAWYYLNAMHRDPITLAGMVAGLGLCALRPMRKHWALAAGILLYCVYVARIGGDFMAGRFFYLPFLGALLLLGKAMAVWRWSAGVGMALLALGVGNVHNPWYNGGQSQQSRSTLVDAHGIADERGWYHDAAALVALDGAMWARSRDHNLDSLERENRAPSVLFWDFLGYMGYGEDPQTYLCDRYALVDPLRARLPMHDLPDWRIGHFERVFPRGYRKTLVTGENHLADGQLREYYNRLCRVTRGPIWSIQRFSEIYHFNLGKYDRLIDGPYYRHPSEISIDAHELRQPHPAGEPYLSPGQVDIYNHRPLTIHLKDVAPFARFEVSLDSESDYGVSFLRQGTVVGDIRLNRARTGWGLAIHEVVVPASAVDAGFDAIRVEGIGGSEYYAIGHLTSCGE